jgi:hypothetical protein
LRKSSFLTTWTPLGPPNMNVSAYKPPIPDT